MTFWTSRRRRYAIIGGISLALVVGLILQAEPQRLAAELSRADMGLIGLAVVLFILSIVMRAARWHLLLVASEHRVRARTVLSQYAVAQALNDLTPVKVVGEGARVVGVNREEGVPIGTALATVVTEKVMDLVLVTAVLLASVLLLFADVPLRPWAGLAFVTGLVAAANVAVIIGLSRPGAAAWAGRVARRITGRYDEEWARKAEVEIDRTVRSFEGAVLASGRSHRGLTALAAAMTLPIWGLEFARLALIMAALGTVASLPAVVVASSLALTVQVFLPAGSGNVAAITDVLSGMGIALTTATAAGLLSVATSIWISVPVALLALALAGRGGEGAGTMEEVSERGTGASDQPEGR